MRVNWGGDQGAMCGRQCDIHRDVPDRTQAVVMIIIAVAEQKKSDQGKKPTSCNIYIVRGRGVPYCAGIGTTQGCSAALGS